MASALLLASAGNTAFFVIFGIFVVAMLTLVVIVILWAVRHDVAGRKGRLARRGGPGRRPPPRPRGPRRPARRDRRHPLRRRAAALVHGPRTGALGAAPPP